ncbi:calponin homology domain-containing protein DDB_G0272472-like isoform X1 [Sardina pilchardus]|uniref:calponin homology domain-containing protein DDB_G0272472-like isoform X1 n=1 Tax=Sardina pilchardus TaxID=27697 RepID=UPI002E13E1E5
MPRTRIHPSEPSDLSSSQESIYSSVVQRSPSDIGKLRVIRRMIGCQADGSRGNEVEIETFEESRCSSTSSGSTLEPVWKLQPTPKAAPLQAVLPKPALPKAEPPNAPPRKAVPLEAAPPKVTPSNGAPRRVLPLEAAPSVQSRRRDAGTSTNVQACVCQECGCQGRKAQPKAQIFLVFPGHPALGYRPTTTIRFPEVSPLDRASNAFLPPLSSTRFQPAPRTPGNQSQIPTVQAPGPSAEISSAEMKKKIRKVERANDLMDLQIVTEKKRQAKLYQIIGLDVRGLPSKIKQMRRDHGSMIEAWEMDRLQRESDAMPLVETKPEDETLAGVQERDEVKTDAPLSSGPCPSKKEGRDVAAQSTSRGLKRTSTFNFLSQTSLSSHGGQSGSDSDSLNSDCSSCQETCTFPHKFISVPDLPLRDDSHEPPSTLICARNLAIVARRNGIHSPPARASMNNNEDSDDSDSEDSSSTDLEEGTGNKDDSTQRIKELQYLILTTEKKMELVKELEKDSRVSYKKEKDQLALKKKDFQKIKKSQLPDSLKRSTKKKLQVEEAEFEQGQKRVDKELKRQTANLKARLSQYKKALKDVEKKEKERQKRLEKLHKEKAKAEKIKHKKIEKEKEKKLQMELAEEREIAKARLMAQHKKDKFKKLSSKIMAKREEEVRKTAHENEKYERRRQKFKRKWTKRIKKATKIKNKITSAPGRFFRLFKPSYGKKVDKVLKEEQMERLLLQQTAKDNEQWLHEEEVRMKQDKERAEEERRRTLAAQQEATEWCGKMRVVLASARSSTSSINSEF